MNKFLVIAHRGASGTSFENSPSAFKKAIALGAEMIETDVQMTSDGELVLMHDNSLKRCTNVSGRISKLTLARLKDIKLKNGEDIWTVERLLEESRGKIQVNLEIKARHIEERLIKLVKKMDLRSQVLFTNFNFKSIQKIKRLDPTCRVGLLTIFTLPITAKALYLSKLVRIGGEALCPQHTTITRSLIQKCHENRLKVFTWTVNEVARMKMCKEFGIDGIMTDHPELALSLRKRESR
ncbi:MAG: glycerophosphodiester phosphodiesterase [Candidatus Helarchaeota archaeon]